MLTIFSKIRRFCLLTTVAISFIPSVVSADEPGRGLTAPFEVHYLRFIIDHHYSALRMTELAAGTDIERDTAITMEEGAAPTPDTATTPAKASMDEIKSMARQGNRMQREEILKAQGFLNQWYGINHTPRLRKDGRAAIQVLEHAAPGEEFDHLFLEVFSRHHYNALEPSQTCIVASDIKHEELHRYCSQIVHAQTAAIENMRKLLSVQFEIHDYQPLKGIKGQHSCQGHARRGSCDH